MSDSIESRPFSGPRDIQRMIELLLAVRPAERSTEYPSAVDLQELLALKQVQANTRLWFAASAQLVGFALVDHYQNLRFEIDQQAAHAGIEPEIIDWGVVCIQNRMRERGESLTLDASCREDDSARIALLERNGFVRQETRSLHMVRSLDEPIQEVRLPAGFRMRHAAGEEEAAALAALHHAAFGTENMTIAERLAMMRVPDYDAALDLVVVAPDGRLAATCLCAIYEEENARSGRSEGYTDPVATHPDFQRQGLARALLLTGLRELKRRGVSSAVLGTSSENLAMRRTAEAVGFRIRSTTRWYEKQVAPGPA